MGEHSVMEGEDCSDERHPFVSETSLPLSSPQPLQQQQPAPVANLLFLLLLALTAGLVLGALGTRLLLGGSPTVGGFSDLEFISFFAAERSSSLQQLYEFGPAAPPLLTVNKPLPPEFPFPVDVNTARLSSFYSLLRAGVGVVVGVAGGSISAGHASGGSVLHQRQRRMYAAQLVQWLNRYYPVRHNGTYRYLHRHVLWNVAKPGSDSYWSSYCLDSQFREIQQLEAFAQPGNRDWVRARQQRRARRSRSGAAAGSEADDLQQLQDVAWHQPDLLLLEFAINDVDDDEPAASPLLNETDRALLRAAAEQRSDEAGVADIFPTASMEHSRGKGMPSGWSAPSMERMVRSLLTRPASPTAVLVLSHCARPNGYEAEYGFEAALHSNQEREAAVARWYNVPHVSVRDRLLYPRASMTAFLGIDAAFSGWWQLGQPAASRGSNRSHVHAAQQSYWQAVSDNLYADPNHLTWAGHRTLSLLLVDELQLFTRQQRNSDPGQGEQPRDGRYPAHVRLPSLTVAQAARSFSAARKTAASQLVAPLMFAENLGWEAAGTRIVCQRQYSAYDPLPGRSNSTQLNVTQPLPPGWAAAEQEGKWGFTHSCNSSNRTAVAQLAARAPLSFTLQVPASLAIALAIRASGTQPVGDAGVTGSCCCEGASQQRFNSSVLIVSGVSSMRQTIVQSAPLPLQPSPAAAPCRYDQLHIQPVNCQPFTVFGYFSA